MLQLAEQRELADASVGLKLRRNLVIGVDARRDLNTIAKLLLPAESDHRRHRARLRRHHEQLGAKRGAILLDIANVLRLHHTVGLNGANECAVGGAEAARELEERHAMRFVVQQLDTRRQTRHQLLVKRGHVLASGMELHIRPVGARAGVNLDHARGVARAIGVANQRADKHTLGIASGGTTAINAFLETAKEVV